MQNMLTQTVFENRGTKFVPVLPKGQGKLPKGQEPKTFRKVPNKVPVGVFVGINDVANGVGCIRTGWSKCHLAPMTAPVTIPEKYLKLMKVEGIRKYEKELKAHENAVKNSDVFNFEQGVAYAMQNIISPSNVPAGKGFAKKYAKFQERCKKYFADVNMVCENGVVTPVVRKVKPHRLLDQRGMQTFEELWGNFMQATNPIKPMVSINHPSLPPEIKEMARFLQTVIGPMKVVGVRRVC